MHKKDFNIFKILLYNHNEIDRTEFKFKQILFTKKMQNFLL